jgi:membrane protease YdiL (CAAX protease family)
MFPERTIFDAGASEALLGVIAALYAALLAAGTVTALVLAVRAARTPLPWDSYGRRLTVRSWSALEGLLALGALLLLVALGLALGFLLQGADAARAVLAQSLVLDGLGLLLLDAYLRRTGRTWGSAFGLSRQLAPSGLRSAFFGYLALMPLLVTSALVYHVLLVAFGYTPTLQDVALLLSEPSGPVTAVLLAFFAVVLAPVFEECLFRGIGLPLLTRHLGIGPAILLTSLAFAAIHAHLPSLVPLTVVAVGFSVGYLYSGSLWVPIAMHALFNAVNLGVLVWVRNG